MKTPEDEAFDDIQRRQLNGHQIKRIQAMARINEDFEAEYEKSQPALAKYRAEEDDDTQVYKKPWVNLTAQEWFNLGCYSVEEVRIGLAIQAKLKEKNG
jgi:hypothetical protein